MSALTRTALPTAACGPKLIGTAGSSPAGPIAPEEPAALHAPPRVRWPRPVQVLWFGLRQASFMLHYRERLGEVWSPRGYIRGQAAVTCHPDHICSLFTAPGDQVPTLAAESPLRPVLGPSSVLTSNGPRHLHQRKLLLPSFHGEAIARYEQMIADAAMRARPVIPITGRRVAAPWRLGDYGVSAYTPIAASILPLHHREDLYPGPFAFRPERWDGHKPGTYEWIPFGGGTRRCLGAALAMAEQRVVLRATAGRLGLEAADRKPERPKHGNVTMIAARGARVIVRTRR